MVTFSLTPTEREWPSLARDLENMPLVSERAITLAALLPFLGRQLNIFLLSDGSMAVAIQVKDAFPASVFEAYDLTIQKIGARSYLLSNEPLPLKRTSSPFSFSSLIPAYLGHLSFSNTGKRVLAPVRRSQYGYEIRLPKNPLSPTAQEGWIEGTFATMSIPVLTNSSIDLEHLSQPFDQILAPLGLFTSKKLVETFAPAGGTIVFVSTDEEKTNFLLQIPYLLNEDAVQQLLQTTASVQHPNQTPLSLPDGSIAQEIRIDPSDTVIERIQIAGNPAWRAQTPNGPLLAFPYENKTVIATEEDLISQWFFSNIQTGKTRELSPCREKPIFFVKLEAVYRQVAKNRMTFSPISSPFFLNTLNEISLNSAPFHDVLRFCR